MTTLSRTESRVRALAEAPGASGMQFRTGGNLHRDGKVPVRFQVSPLPSHRVVAVRSILGVLGLVFSCLALCAAETFRIDNVRLGDDGRPRLEVSGREDSYYLLYQGDTVHEIDRARDLQLGGDRRIELVDDSVYDEVHAQFYRVRRFPKIGAETVDVVARNGLAFAASGAVGGVSVFRTVDAQEPAILAQVDIPGEACRLALAGDHLAVAAGWGGLVVVDVRVPHQPQVRHRLPFGLRACAVAADDEVVYVVFANGELAAVDCLTGGVRQRLKLSEPAWDIALEGEVLYAIGRTTLFVLPVGPLGVSVARTVAAPQPGIGNRMFVGSRFIFAPCGHGYNRFDIVDPLNPVALPVADSPHSDWKFVIADGSGSALAAVEDATIGLRQSLRLLNVGADGRQSTFLSSWSATWWAKSATFYGGRAYVAGGPGRLQVVQPRPADTAGVPPTIRLNARGFSEGVECGQTLLIRAEVADDVQVREVEFHIDGVQVAADGNYPFEHRFRAPPHLGSGAMTIQARVSDTGGNAVWSETRSVFLRVDRTPPNVFVPVLKFGLLIGRPFTFEVCFSESVLGNSLPRSRFRLRHCGPDRRLDTDDDVGITNFELLPEAAGRTVTIMLANPIPPGRCRLRVEPGIEDQAGNASTAVTQIDFSVLDGVDHDEDGVPDELEPSLGLQANTPDSDRDEVADGLEDGDGDGIGNAAELLLGTNPTLADSGGGGGNDGQEDSDRDGVPNAQELQLGLNPLEEDSDGDGWYDEAEITAGSDPASAASRPSVAVYARPSVTVLRPSTTPPADSRLAAVVAQPAISVLRPTVQLPEGQTLGAVIAEPEFILLRPVTDPPEELSPGAVIAVPALRIRTTPP